jgi:hypothetical protein
MIDMPVPTIQTSYVGVPQEDVDTLKEALTFLGVQENTKFWSECVVAIITQHRMGHVIAWPPQFVLQNRSEEYIELKLDQTRRYLTEQIKEEKPKRTKRK